MLSDVSLQNTDLKPQRHQVQNTVALTANYL